MNISDFSAYLKKVDPELAKRPLISKLELEAISTSRVPLNFGRLKFVLSMSKNSEVEEVEIYGAHHYNIGPTEKGKIQSLAEVTQKYEVDLKLFGGESTGKICSLYTKPRLFVGGELEEATSNIISAQNEIIYALERFEVERAEMLGEHSSELAKVAIKRVLKKAEKRKEKPWAILPRKSYEEAPLKRRDTADRKRQGYENQKETPLGNLTEKEYIVKRAEQNRDSNGRIRNWEEVARDINNLFGHNRNYLAIRSMYQLLTRKGELVKV